MHRTGAIAHAYFSLNHAQTIVLFGHIIRVEQLFYAGIAIVIVVAAAIRITRRSHRRRWKRPWS